MALSTRKDTAAMWEAFTDRYNSRVIVRLQEGHTHIQLLVKHDDGTDYSYGFTQVDFQTFATQVAALAERLRVAGLADATC